MPQCLELPSKRAIACCLDSCVVGYADDGLLLRLLLFYHFDTNSKWTFILDVLVVP